jgi:hypothetical protein
MIGNCTTSWGRDEAAVALNQRFMELVNSGCTRDDVEKGMCPN